MFCNNCGTKLEDGSLFCPECGTKVEVVEEATVETVEETTVETVEEATVETVEDATEEVVEETASEVTENETATEVAEEINNEAVVETANENTEKKEKSKLIPMILIGIVALAAVVGIIFAIIKLLPHGSNKPYALVYAKDNSLGQWTGKKSAEISDHLYEDKDSKGWINAFVSKDGKYLFYPKKASNSNYTLYYKKLNDLKSEGEKIDSEVFGCNVLDDNRVIYSKGTYLSSKLYIYDYKEKQKIASDVSSFWVSEDCKTVMWLSSEDGKLYKQDTKLKNDKEKLESGIDYMVYISDQMDKMVYVKDNNLYYLENFEDREKVASDVTSVRLINEYDNPTLVFIKSDDITTIDDISLIVDDDMAASDAKLKEPDIKDYQKTETRRSYWGTREYTVTDDSYYDALEEYYNKENRDYFREDLKSMAYLSQGTLYSYSLKDKEKTEIFEGPVEMINASADIYAYGVTDTENIKKAKFSELYDMGYSEAYELIHANIAASAKTLVYDGKESKEMTFDEEFNAKPYTVSFDSDNKLAIFVLEQDGSEVHGLAKYAYAKKDAEVEMISDDISSMETFCDGSVYYIVDADEKEGDLYKDGEQIATDVLINSVYSGKDGKSVQYIKDANDKREGELWRYDGKETKIADEVYEFATNEKGNIAFIAEYNFKKSKGDLFEYKNGKVTKIDEDVCKIVIYQ